VLTKAERGVAGNRTSYLYLPSNRYGAMAGAGRPVSQAMSGLLGVDVEVKMV
jgi:hypothetical protein